MECGHILIYNEYNNFWENNMGITISKSQFKPKALEVMRMVESSGESVVITDHGSPALELRPVAKKSALEELRGSVISFNRPTDPVADDDWELS